MAGSCSKVADHGFGISIHGRAVDQPATHFPHALQYSYQWLTGGSIGAYIELQPGAETDYW